MNSPQLYWVMTGDDFTLDLNNPNEPKILCVGNNPDRQNIYSAALGLYNSRIVKLVNKKGQLKSSIIIDELPTIYFRGIYQPSGHIYLYQYAAGFPYPCIEDFQPLARYIRR